MLSKLVFAGSLLLLSGTLGQAFAGTTISDKRYWPNEVGPAASASSARSSYAATRYDARAQIPAPAIAPRSFTYQGGPKTGSWSLR
jgi:hypothetical protein